MKKFAFILMLGFISLVFTLTGCSKHQPTPQERFQSYLSDWQKQDFSAMYALLSNHTKKQISKKAFVSRYQNIYQDFEIDNLKTQGKFKKPKNQKSIDTNKDGKVKLPFSIKMQTMAGPVSFSENTALVKEKRKNKNGDKTTNWYVNWNTKMIFPQMENSSIEVHGKTLPASRGEIIDRFGKPLAENGTIVSIGIWPAKLQGGSKKQLSSVTGVPLKVIDQKLSASWVTNGSFVPIKQYPSSDATIKKATAIPGIVARKTPARVYPFGKAAGHLTGYIGSVTAEDLKKLQKKGYDKSDKIGKSGLEAIFEKQLHGSSGGVIYTTDKKGTKLQTIAKKEPVDGQNIKLTIDANLEKRLYDEMSKNGDAGTAAAINPKNGQVLALVSTPSFDPNQFILGYSDQQWKALQSDPKKPLVNRIENAYSPGSTFKPITASIALKTNAINPDKNMHIDGPWQPNKSWGNYHVTREDTVSSINLRGALIRSDNIYFARTALKIGAQSFAKEAKKFGIGEKLPSFPFPIQRAQLTSNGKFESQIQLANTGYGQGQVLTSPLQLATAYTPFVNAGNLIQPVIEMQKAKEGPQIWKKKVISPQIANRITQDLIQVVQSPYGTATGARIDGKTIAGKTGTAELKKNLKVKNGKENGWFVGFNVKNSKIMIAMMIQNVQNKHGSRYVVPKVADTLKWYLKQ